ncbi:sirohydrochlorin cobaltochelatase [Klebsiella pneumoniae]|uniref:Sirohydrochlorin cobaltochelatase n=1 Tax=Klebsiella pneumoniae TaxID=573 RepID=A0A939NND7_KLEPN|nr:sirohydrochlorin cobaltochelatase [Klebsiella pneumoniae]
MKKALLVVSFGTSYHDTARRTSPPASAIWPPAARTARCSAPSPRG